MWKKVFIALVSLVGTFSVVYAMNREMFATKTPVYYEYGDTFEQTNKNTFTMGGYEWSIIYTDQATGTGYIGSRLNNSGSGISKCEEQISNFSGYGTQIIPCLNLLQPIYASGNDDVTAQFFKKISGNSFTTLTLPSTTDYRIATSNESNMSIDLPYGKVLGFFSWLSNANELGQFYVRWVADTSSYAVVPEAGFKYVYSLEFPKQNYSKGITPVFPVNLPIRMISKLNATTSLGKTFTYGDANIKDRTKLANFSVDHGEGPYTFSIESGVTNNDVDESGQAVVNGKTLSSDFELTNINISNGTADLSLKAGVQLTAGDYYVKVKVKDDSTNVRIPYDSATDTYREKTVVLKFTVNKATPTLSFTDATQTNLKIGDSAYKGEISHTNTDTITANDITYQLTGGTNNVLAIEKNTSDFTKYDVNVVSTYMGTGLPATFTLSAKIAETTNFNEVTVEETKNIYVFKDMSDFTWSASKGSYMISDVTSGSKVGTLSVSNGGAPFTYGLVGTDDAMYDEAVGKDNDSFMVENGTDVASGKSVDVKTRTSLTSGTYKMQFKVTDALDNVAYQTASIEVTTKTQTALDFKTGANGTVLTKTGQRIKFNDNNVSLYAEGGSTDNIIEYGFAPDSMQDGKSPSDYATINKTSGLITPKRTGTIKVQAKRPGDNTYGDIITYMNLTIDPAEQEIIFNDTSSIINIKEGASKKVDATGTIKSSGLAGIGPITYSINDTSIATVDDVGNVTGVKAGNVTLTATMNKSDESGYDSNYDTVTKTKSIKIYKGMSVTWNAVTPKLMANANAIGNKVGTLTVTDNASDPSFAISLNSTNMPQNADASFFKVVDNGTTADVQIAKKISASDWANHGGIFKVQVDVTDSNGTKTIDVIVTLDEADNDAYFTSSGTKITAITKKYGENGNAFTLTSKTDGIGTVYSAISDPSGVLNVLGTGEVTINKVGSATVQVIAGAGNGYAQKKVTMVVQIEQGDQSIAFKDTTTLNRPFIKDTTFTETIELKETSLDTVSTRNITYTSNDNAVCEVDTITGVVTMKATGNCDITASNNDANWTQVSANKVINLYDGMGVSFKQTTGLQAEVTSTNAGAKAGSLTVSGGIDPKTYAVSIATGAKNKDASKFQVNSTGIVSFKTAVMASDLAGKYNTTKKVYELYVQIETTDSLNTKVTTDAIVEIKGAPLKASFDTKGTGKITEVYDTGKTFTLDLTSNKGDGTPTYQLKNDPSMPSDVLQSVDASGLVTILHANDKTFIGNPLKVEAVIPPSNGYDGETIETEVVITQATQPDFAFTTTNIKLGHGASITPIFTGQLSSGTISMTSGNNALATINGNDIKAKSTDGTVTITAVESGDRDYQSAVTTASITINSAPSYSLIINVPSATYGDTGLKATATAVGSIGTNPVLTWSSSDPSIADIDASGDITIKKAGSVTITCTRTTTGEPSVTATAILVIDPKLITVTIDNTSKYVGEIVPKLHATIPTSELVGSDTMGQPVFSCKDGSTLVDANTKAGKYDITGTYPTGSEPNYDILVTKGELTIKQDASQASWFHLEGATSATTLNPNDWHKEDVNVVLDNATESAGTYDEISLDNAIWDNTISVDTEGNFSKDIAFRIKDTKALSTTQTTIIKIDETKPIITEITGTEANRNALEELLNKLTNGKYFKPHLEVSIKAEDILPKGVNENSKLKTIHYDAYQLKSDGTLSDVIASGEMKSTDVLKLVDEGMYMVCATAEDGAGNISDEKCSGIRIHKIGESSDDKELPDINIDYDGDGVADINITRPGEKKPYLNIDINGDGIADINISREGEKVIPGTTEAFLNIISPETKWNPTKEIDFDKDGLPDFRTDASLEAILAIDANGDKIPDLNIDLDGDYIPEINIDANGDKTPETNIDSDGDMKADINIDKVGNGIPTEGICTSVTWNPTKMVEKDGKIIYATTPELKPDVKDSLTDNGITIKPKPGDNTTFLPNYALKVDDVTESVDEQTKNTIIEITGSDSEVKQVFDVSLSDGEKIIQPNGSILVRIPVDTSIKNPRVLVKNAKGEFKEVSVSIEDGFYVFETDYLGMVSIVGDKEIAVEPTPTPDKEIPTYQKPDTSVKGMYTGGVGGAGTGDSTNVLSLSIICMVMGITLVTVYRKEM